MKSKKTIIVLLLIITLFGGFLRFYQNTQNPNSLNGDEISFGYSAYSVLKTGKDEYGTYLPLTFKSVGDYKNPVPTYLMIPPIAIWGLNDFSVRFPNAFFGTLTIPIFFFFLNKILKNKWQALLGTFLLSISAWHIYYSRFAYEALIASLFVLLGTWFFMKMLEGKKYWAVLSALFFVLTMYTAFAERLFVPVFVLGLLIIYSKKLFQIKKSVVLFLVSCLVLGLPLVYVALFSGANTRLSMVFLSVDIDFVRYINFGPFNNILQVPLLIFFWLRRYLNYLQPDYLFTGGMNITNNNFLGLGVMYLFELPLFILGIKELIQRKIPYKPLIFAWLFLGIIPDSLTNNLQHAGRILHIFPVIILINTLGAVSLFSWIKSLSKSTLRITVTGIYLIAVVIILIQSFLVIVVHSPKQKGESFDEGLREVAQYAIAHKNEYQNVVIDPRRGIAGPYLISNPFLYVLFYEKYDPYTYQIEPKTQSSEPSIYGFDKYTFRYINWTEDRTKKDTLFIGSPWSFSDDLKPEEILKKIYLVSGDVAFYVVSPK